MLTAVQKEILQTLINLYRTSKCTSVKCENIADLMGRNSGTIRNQMQSLRSLGLVQGVPGPRGGYKPTLEAYHTLNIENDPCEVHVPISVNGEFVSDIAVNKIEFTSILRPGACEATITALGDIKQLDLDDQIKIGPTPVNNLTVIGTIIGRDDVDNAILIKTHGIFSIPIKHIKELAKPISDTVNSESSVSDAASLMLKKNVTLLPVEDEGKVIGVINSLDVLSMLSKEDTNVKIKDFLNEDIVIINETNTLMHSMSTLKDKDVTFLILQDKNNEITGIVTIKDILISLVNYSN